MSTKINWTDESWNIIIGCEKISPGCKNCYAEKMAYRLAWMERLKLHKFKDLNYPNVIDFVTKKWNGKTHFAESQLEKPLKWKKPRMIFVCSMGDLFHESVPFEWIDKVFEVIEKCPQHTFQVLTKRPEIMYKYMVRYGIGAMPDNIWLGVTAENQEQANKRIPILLQIPAKVRFVSIEPMLDVIDLECFPETGCPSDSIDNLGWVICGGESGHHARPMHPDWVRSLKEQCESADVPFFFKQGSENNWPNFKDFDSFPEDLQIRQMPNLK